MRIEVAKFQGFEGFKEWPDLPLTMKLEISRVCNLETVQSMKLCNLEPGSFT